MNIAVFHELHRGGARRATNEFAQQLKKLGHKVDLFTIDIGEKNDESLFYDKINYYKFSPRKWSRHDWQARLYKDTVELIKIFLLDRKIAKDIEAGSYDLAFISASEFIESPFILHFLKIPKFFYCHDPYYRMIYEPDLFNKTGVSRIKLFYEKLNRFIRKYLDKWDVKKIDFVICASKFIQEKFYLTYGKKGNVVYGGVDTSFFFPDNKKEREIDILFIGSEDFLDGYPLFEKILKRITVKVNVKTILSENEWLTDTQLREIYRKSKLLIATSYNEPLGLLPLEAMACGVVVLAVNEAGYKETVLDGETGYLIDRDEEKFSKKINWLLKNQKLIEKMSNDARENAIKNWTWKEKGRELEKILISKIKAINLNRP